jgi:hypothetical protein
VKGMLGFVGMTLGSALGWWAGAQVGYGTAAILSGVGSGLGLWAFRWLSARYLE